jgi:selenocysteine lyase/cysteine desulfurase
VVKKGQEAMSIKARPYNIDVQHHFFGVPNEVRALICKIIHGKTPDRIALLPSVSYGMAIVAKNLKRLPEIRRKKKIIIVADEFPNNIYTFQKAAQDLNLACDVIPTMWHNQSQYLLDAIDSETALVVMPVVHWIYGKKYDIKAISERCKTYGALLVVDGTQSIGALEFDIKEAKVDALIGATYKWLLGPYGHAFGYFGEFFDEGEPIEESWINRVDSHIFSELLAYKQDYRPLAQRYNVGEYSHFIQMPMIKEALLQVLEWGVDNIQNHCSMITTKALAILENLGFELLDEKESTKHLIGLRLPANIESQALYQYLISQSIFVSLRDTCLRVSPHLYNDEEDLLRLVKAIKTFMSKSNNR